MKVALVGNQNSGKTTVFNYLTGITGVIKIIADAIVGAALYVIISIVLRIEELNEVLSMLKNKVAKGER